MQEQILEVKGHGAGKQKQNYEKEHNRRIIQIRKKITFLNFFCMFQVTFSEKHSHLGKKENSREENKLNQETSKRWMAEIIRTPLSWIWCHLEVKTHTK